MPVNFNSKPLEMFHGAQFANANSIVNLDGDNKLKSNGKLGRFFMAHILLCLSESRQEQF